MKISKVLKPHFNVLITRVDNKRIKGLQVSSNKRKQKAKITSKIIEEPVNHEFEDIEPESIEEPTITKSRNQQ
jgi:hypothetical protein